MWIPGFQILGQMAQYSNTPSLVSIALDMLRKSPYTVALCDKDHGNILCRRSDLRQAVVSSLDEPRYREERLFPDTPIRFAEEHASAMRLVTRSYFPRGTDDATLPGFFSVLT